jgi:hypothetical protein
MMIIAENYKDIDKSQIKYKKMILILSILCMDAFYCGYCLAYLTALGPTTI